MNFKELNKICAVTSLLYTFALAACQGTVAGDTSSSSNVVSAEKPSTVMAVVQDAVVAVGEGLVAQQGQVQGAQAKVSIQPVSMQSLISDQLCDRNAMPLNVDGTYMDSQGADYPSRLFYCKLAKSTSSPESIPGALKQIKSISCAVERAGVVYDNQEHQVTVQMDSNCFSPEQLQDMGVTTSMNVTLRASKPAFFNSYYDTGISIKTAEFGEYRFAAKIVGTTVEFLTSEDQTANSANKTGSFAASFDILTGELRYESRSDRYLCAEISSCGWSRHDRILATVAMSNGVITAVSNIQGASADVYDGRNGQYSARSSTIKGNLADGLKARYFHVQSTNVDADLGDSAKYSEVVNNRCYTNGSDQGDCGANTGIAFPQNGPFVFGLHPTANATTSLSWAAQLQGLKFSSVTFADVQ
ncbi:hypothetical protein [Bdellovibrio svalbardensis]|uniref:Lipoprotein n=1 Tax=Bdellovibrio svalbardensis TaxID=2972972 RepID=A0ABT6DLE0_9BACT|nr:hypothetical protein [Bdellovibrio svalbardensis]MDG0817692.1 hypothetical protein [Bdellovibrio svalbardensis]